MSGDKPFDPVRPKRNDSQVIAENEVNQPQSSEARQIRTPEQEALKKPGKKT